MILKQGNFLEAKYKVNLLLATGNSVVGPKGLVMGKGSALAMKWAYKGCEKIFAQHIYDAYYGLIVLDTYNWLGNGISRIGLFQTKYHWRENSDLNLIRSSTQELFKWLTLHPNDTVAMPFPGIGNGGLARELVLPIISLLPDNVTVYEKE